MDSNHVNDRNVHEFWLFGELKPVRQTLIFSISASLLATIAAVLLARILAVACHRAVIDGASVATIQPFALYLLFLAGVRCLFTYLGERLASKAAFTLKKEIRSRLYRRILTGRPRDISEESGALVEAVTQGVESLEPYVSRFIPHLFVAAFFPPLFILLLFPLDWRSALVLLFSAPFIPLFMVLIGKGAQNLNRRQWTRLAIMSGHLIDLIRGLPDLKICNAAKREAATVASVTESYRHATMAVLRVAFLSAFTLEFFATVGTALVAVMIGFRLLGGSLTLVDGLFVLLVAPEFYLPFRTLGLSYHARMQGVAAAEKLAPLLVPEQPQEKGDRETTVPDGALSLEFEEVTFRHGDGRGGVSGINLQLQSGTVTALVGASGAGKSTLARLLLALEPLDTGIITANGIDIRRFDLKSWHRKLAWLPQKPFFFCGTVRDNLGIGLESCSDDKIYEILDSSGAFAFVRQLPGTLDYRLGEAGAGLSGGELRRLAIARILLRQPRLVILDEPTAGLDSENERLAMAAITRLASGRTLLLISHRDETVTWADRTVRLIGGRIDRSEGRCA